MITTKKTKQKGRWILAVGLAVLTASAVGQANTTLALPFKLGNFDLDSKANLQVQVVNGDQQSAKFNEYRDLTTGVSASGDARLTKDAYFTEFTFKEPGRTDQQYKLSGGAYDRFSYKLFLTAIPHNLSYGDRTFFEGLESDNLHYLDHPYNGPDATATTDTSGASGTAGWVYPFNYGIQRYNYGAEGRLALTAPFYGSFGVQRQTISGLKPLAYDSVELPEHVDYVNDIAFMQVAYRTKRLNFSGRYEFSHFMSGSDYLYFQDPKNQATPKSNPDNVDHVTVAPSSDMHMIVLGGVVDGLPLYTTLSMRGSWTWLLDNITLDPRDSTEILNGVSVFHGNVQDQKADVSLTSSPLPKLNTHIYGSYLNHYNGSTDVAINMTEFNRLYHYSTWNAGLDGSYRLPYESWVSAGYKYKYFDRPTRNDAPTSNDNNIYVKVRNSYLDWLDASLKLQALFRSTQFNGWADVIPGDTSTTIDGYLMPFDTASKHKYKLTAETDITPIEYLDVTLMYSVWRDSYPDTTIGKTSDFNNEGYLDSDYSFKLSRHSRRIHVSGFLDAEKTTINSSHRYAGATFGGNPTHANTDPTSGYILSGGNQAFNWTTTEKTLDWGYGLTLKAPVVRHVTVCLSWLQNLSSGSRAFSTDPIVQAAMQLEDLGILDNVNHSVVNVKATYAVTKKLSATLGFLYDRLRYTDDAWSNYELKPEVQSANNGSLSPAAYLTGAYADTSYTAQTYYIAATYRM